MINISTNITQTNISLLCDVVGNITYCTGQINDNQQLIVILLTVIAFCLVVLVIKELAGMILK